LFRNKVIKNNLFRKILKSRLVPGLFFYQNGIFYFGNEEEKRVVSSTFRGFKTLERLTKKNLRQIFSNKLTPPAISITIIFALL